MAFFDKVGVSVIFLGPRATTRVAPTVCARSEKSFFRPFSPVPICFVVLVR